VEIKTCTKCKKTKTLELFRNDSRLKSGKGSVCIECHRERALATRNKDVGKARQKSKEWALKNPDKATKNKLKWAKENKDRVLQQGREYHARNRVKRLASQKTARANNPEKYKLAAKKWRSENIGRIIANNALRHANKLQRTPKWLTKEDKAKIKALYIEARQRTVARGESWHVDHIIPLQGKLVSGLHVPNNLQILHWKDNLEKHHKFIPE
jgi:flagellar biosynthesis GTPase FlhF